MSTLAAQSPKTHFLHPGDVALGLRGDRLETLLGSCVSIILTDPRRTIGVMCHIVHGGGGGAKAGASADGAWAGMRQLLLARGITPRLCDAFVYGGGNMFPSLVRGKHVGASNADRALALLAQDGNRIVVQDLGGAAYRRLSWTIGTDLPTVTSVAV